jgi:IclR family KDG regulon transcriptional repressor
MTDPKGVRPLSSVLKVFALLEVLVEARKSLRLAELTRLVGGGRATVYQRLVTLMEAGWVEQTEDGSFRLTMHSAGLANAALEQANLGIRTVPILQQLVDETSETASLAVLDGDEARIVQRVESEGVLRAELKVGARLSLDNSASGRVLAAFTDSKRLQRWIDAGIAIPSTEMLEQVRRERFAISGDRMQGIMASAAPVFEASGRVLAALSLVGPQQRFQAEKERAPLLAAAERITQMIRGQAI